MQGRTGSPDMRTIAALIVLTMITAGCAEKERYPERYLDSINVSLHQDRPAEVSGLLRDGASPANALEYPDMTGTSRISFECGPEDSANLEEQRALTPVPFDLETADEGMPVCVRYWQEGISWRPLYSWNTWGDSCRFAARIMISNETGREWFSQNTVMYDLEGDPVCHVPDTLLIRNGDMELGWWSARGRVLPLTLRYGWPRNSQWNQLLPCIVPGAGSITGSEWPLRTGDTLWIHPSRQIEISERVSSNSSGYECSLVIHNQTDTYMEVRIDYPETTPRGAVFQPVENIPSLIGLAPGDIRILEYEVIYR